MSKAPPVTVFISSKISGFEEYRAAVIDAINDLQSDDHPIHAKTSESSPAKDDTPRDACLEMVRECDVYLGIFGKVYSEPTEEEFKEAYDCEKPMVLFIQDDCEPEPKQQKFLEPKNKWGCGRLCNFFRAPADLKYNAYRTLRNLREIQILHYVNRIAMKHGNLPLSPHSDSFLPVKTMPEPHVIEVPPVETLEIGGETKTQDSDKEPQAPPVETLEIAGETYPQDSDKEQDSDKKPQAQNLFEVVKEHIKEHKGGLVIFGNSGAGKTTAMRWLSYQIANEQFGSGDVNGRPEDTVSGKRIPILVRLENYQANQLMNQVVQSLGLRDDAANPRILKSLRRKHQIILLFDGFDEVREKKQFLDDIRSVTKEHEGVSYVLTSRPSHGLEVLGAAYYELASLTDEELLKLFTIHLGTGRAMRLLDTVKRAGVLGVCRRPLMAWYVALSVLGKESDEIQISKGPLFKNVLEEKFMKQWEASTRLQHSPRQTEFEISCLANLGFHMQMSDSVTLARGDVEGIFRSARSSEELWGEEYAESTILERSISRKILERVGSEIRFAHAELQDYFAARWLAENWSLRKVLSLSWDRKWHSCITFVAGLVDTPKCRELLRKLIRSLRRFKKLPKELFQLKGGTDRIFLVLRCLNNSRFPHDDLKDNLVDLLFEGRVLHCDATVPIDFSYMSGPEKVESALCVEVGLLGTPLAKKLLMSGVYDRRYSVGGLAHTGDPEMAKVMLEGIGEERNGKTDTTADLVAVEALFNFPYQTAIEAVQHFLSKATSKQKKRMLEALQYVLHGGKTQNVAKLADERLMKLLTDIALEDESQEVGDAAFQALLQLREESDGIPPVAVKWLIQVASDGQVESRTRAVRYLMRSWSSGAMDAIEKALRDKELIVRLTALQSLHWRNSEKFARYVVLEVEKIKEIFPDWRELIEKERQEIRGSFDQAGEPDHGVVDDVALLSLTRLLKRPQSLRTFSIIAMSKIGGQLARPYLVQFFLEDEAPTVRREALEWLHVLLGKNVVAYLIQASEDESPEVRRAAADIAGDLSPSTDSQLISLLHKLSDDPDENVQRGAQFSLEKYDTRPDDDSSPTEDFA